MGITILSKPLLLPRTLESSLIFLLLKVTFLVVQSKNYGQDDWDDNNDTMDINYGNEYINANYKRSQV